MRKRITSANTRCLLWDQGMFQLQFHYYVTFNSLDEIRSVETRFWNQTDQYEENITQEWIEKIRYEKNYLYDTKHVDDIRLKLRNVHNLWIISKTWPKTIFVRSKPGRFFSFVRTMYSEPVHFRYFMKCRTKNRHLWREFYDMWTKSVSKLVKLLYFGHAGAILKMGNHFYQTLLSFLWFFYILKELV